MAKIAYLRHKVTDIDFTRAVDMILDRDFFQYMDTFYQFLGSYSMGAPIFSSIPQTVMKIPEKRV